METIDIQNKSFVLRWVKVKRGDVVNYQLKPLKRSICFGIYKKVKDSPVPSVTVASKGSPSQNWNLSSPIEMPQVHIEADDTNLMTEFRNRALSLSSSTLTRDDLEDSNGLSPSPELQVRLDQSGLLKVLWNGNVNGNELHQGSLSAEDDTEDSYYAFVLDNTYSKTARKKVLFNASVIHHPPYYDCESTLSKDENTQDFPSCTNSTSVYGLPTVNNYSQSELFRLKQGRILQGYLLKKRRKRLQGFKKRFFKLDYKYGTLSYYINERNSVCRGEMVINLSTVSANKKTRLIVIDSGMEIWALKAREEQEWLTWIEAIQSCYNKQNSKNAVENASQKVNLQGQAQALMTELHLAQTKLQECKNYAMRNSQYYERNGPKNSVVPTPSDSGSSTLSSTKVPFIRNRNVSVAENSNGNNDARIVAPLVSNSTLGNHASSNNLNGQANENMMYEKLTELEHYIATISTQCRMIFTSPLFVTFTTADRPDKNASTKSSAAASVFSEEFFDALDDVNAVIMLDDEEGVDTLDQKLFNGSMQQILDEEYETDTSRALVGSEFHDIQRTPSHDIQRTPSPDKQSSDSKGLFPLPITETIIRRDDVLKPTTPPPSLLSFLRKNVGKDLNSISMPITSNEPITVLQLMAETFEYSELLTNAALTENPIDRLAFVAAFAMSYLSIHRVKARAMRKPLNPLLGETYELIREDKGFRLISEKVSHKPQVFAFHVEHSEWECNYAISPVQKFWGKSLEFTNEGIIRVTIKSTGEKFQWSQPSMLLKNIITGERYVEPSNQFEVTSSEGARAVVSFKHSGMFSSRSEDLNILLYDKNGKLCDSLKGQWTSGIIHNRTGEVIWKVGDLIADAPKKFGFTKFAANLNGITKLEEGNLPPTDCRLRPDLRLYEAGVIEASEELKLKLEKQQRERRNNGLDFRPLYFTKHNGEWRYITGSNSYWEKRRRQDWHDAPQIW
ncbi:HCL408Wp [Eremothecium sinecaudum]|uniref:HCL408Wp n=1 Tax=Eremothecium sinecaudum TaxID=45286 RepID=A0A109UY74_9SACH|nr:HCL408Wp [Eremothecium sinecaudum]AMD19743.1 HCL408Wp [Eremothecium sinecaudum]